jgi:predicted ATPase
VSINGHKFIASISTEDLGELLTQKYADIYEEISTRQSQVLEEISREMQNNPDKDKVSEIPQDASALLNAIQKVNKEREQLSKPFSVLSALSRKILRYNAIRVTGRVVRGETTDGITLGEGRDGITVGEAKDAISSDKLSAGEKQMLSFLCYNVFSEGMAIFIDEPELSLHVDWQRRLLPTLLKQGQKNQFFVATHSPFIYSKYPDKEFMLDDDRGGV